MKNNSALSRKITRKILALVTGCSLLLSVSVIASATFLDYGYEQVTESSSALSKGQGYKLITDFSSEETVNKQLHITNGGPGGHQNFSIQSEDAFDGSLAADYIQFEIDNPSNKDAELFYLTLQAPAAANYKLQLIAGKGYSYYDFAAGTWTDMTVEASTTYYGEIPCLKVPAGTHGIVRIPFTSVSGGSADNDSYVRRDNLITFFEIYAHIPDPDGPYTLTFDNIAYVSEAVPTGYDAQPEGYNAALENGLGAKLIDDCSSYENGKIELAITNGGVNGHKSFTINPFADPKGSARADYLQFEVSNPANKDQEIFFITLQTSAAGYQLKLQNGGKYSFYNFTTESWSEFDVAASTTYYGETPCIKVPAASEGVLRIPFSDFAGATAENDKYVKDAELITGIDMYTHIPDPDGPYTVSFDNFCYVGGTPFEAEKEPETELEGYSDTDLIKLNDGEVAKLITGLEEGDPATHNAATGGEISAEAKHNGEYGLNVYYSDGSWGGFKNFSFDTTGISDWSEAKYLQFYVKNTCPESVGGTATNPLEIFYFEINNNPKCMLNYGAEGIKLYSLTTGKWSDIDVVENTFHLMPDETKVPGIKIPAGFEGYVRIPLKAINFTQNLEEALPNVTELSMYSLIPGVPGGSSVYYDDFYLVSYSGDTAPEYQDDKVSGEETGGNDDGQDDYGEKEFTLTGVIVDKNGAPIKNAKVTLNSSRDFISSAKGEYQFEDVSTGFLDLTVTADGGEELGFVSFGVKVGTATGYDGGEIVIGENADAITVNIVQEEFGFSVSSVSEGAINGIVEGTAGDYNSGSAPEISGGDNSDVPLLGDFGNCTAVCILFIASAAVVTGFLRKKIRG